MIVLANQVVDLTIYDSEDESREGTQATPRIGPPEFAIFRSKQYLNDTILNATIRLIMTRTDQVNYLNTYFMEYVTNSVYDSTTTDRGIKLIRDHPNQTWFIPINHGGQHWLFLSIHPLQHIIRQHDSLPTFTQQDYTTPMCALLQPNSLEIWTGRQHPTPRQQNSYNCGVFVLARILHLAQGRAGSQRGNPSCTRLLEYLTHDPPPKRYMPHNGRDRSLHAQ